MSKDPKQPARILTDAAYAAILSAARHRFLTASEVYKLLHGFRRLRLHDAPSSGCGIRSEPAQRPRAGSWYLFAPGARLRSDGHSYEKRAHKGFMITREQHVKLSVPFPSGEGSFPAVRGYYSVQEGGGAGAVCKARRARKRAGARVGGARTARQRERRVLVHNHVENTGHLAVDVDAHKRGVASL